VFLDGRNIGKTPLILTKDLGKGAHMIEVAHRDYLPAKQEIQVAKGRELKISVTLEKKPTEVAVAPAPAPAPEPKAPEPPLVPVGGTKIGGGKEEKDPAQLLPPPPPPPPPVEDKKVAEEKIEPKPLPETPRELPGRYKPPKPEPRPFLPSFEEVGGVEKKKEEPPIEETKPIYKQWWFWTAVGAVVTGGVVGLVVGMTGEEEGIPAGKGRVIIDF
jgi:hypothetical protein